MAQVGFCHGDAVWASREPDGLFVGCQLSCWMHTHLEWSLCRVACRRVVDAHALDVIALEH